MESFLRDNAVDRAADEGSRVEGRHDRGHGATVCRRPTATIAPFRRAQ
jgi:hypothetical protein